MENHFFLQKHLKWSCLKAGRDAPDAVQVTLLWAGHGPGWVWKPRADVTHSPWYGQEQGRWCSEEKQQSFRSQVKWGEVQKLSPGPQRWQGYNNILPWNHWNERWGTLTAVHRQPVPQSRGDKNWQQREEKTLSTYTWSSVPKWETDTNMGRIPPVRADFLQARVVWGSLQELPLKSQLCI